MEYVVTLHTPAGDVRSTFPAHMQPQAISLWQLYVENGKNASLTLECLGHDDQAPNPRNHDQRAGAEVA